MAKPMLRVLAGEAIWPPPIWLMRQAGRYLPEYREVRAQAGDFLALCTNPTLAAEVTLQPLRRFGMDAAILFSDILVLPWALGQTLRFEQGEGPVLEPIRDRAALHRLDPRAAPDRYAPVLEALRLLAPQVGDATLIGFAGAPFTVACYMVDGSGSKDFPATRLLAYTEPALFAELITLLVDATVQYLAAQVEAGAETLMLFDSWAGLLPPAHFAQHVIEPARRIVAGVRERHPDVPIIGFPRLAGTSLPAYAAMTGVQAVGLDTGVDPAFALHDGIARQGNLDPLALVAGGAALERDTDAILAAARGRPWIFNLGHGIVPPTPPAHVADLVAHVRAAPRQVEQFQYA
jgi:uroporphyrinogen decarboxylase